jgi:hypothetical protein
MKRRDLITGLAAAAVGIPLVSLDVAAAQPTATSLEQWLLKTAGSPVRTRQRTSLTAPRPPTVRSGDVP